MDLRTGAVLTTLTGHNGPVDAVTCAQVDGVPVAITGGTDRTARIWDIVRPKTPMTLSFPGPVRAVGTSGSEAIVLAHGREVLAISLKPQRETLINSTPQAVD